MGQAEIMEIAAAFTAALLLTGLVSWLISKKSAMAAVTNALIGGIASLILSIFNLVVLSPASAFMIGFLGVAGVVLLLFINPPF